MSDHSSARTTIGLIILSAVAATASFTMHFEGTVYKAYLDDTGHPTICNGHTKSVRLGDVASKETCIKYYNEDKTQAITQAIKVSPEIVDNKDVLNATGDFVLNAGIGAYVGSPMYTNFRNRQWGKGCDSFENYWVYGTYPRPKSGYFCKPKPGTNKYYCRLNGLVERRYYERRLCYGINDFPDFASTSN